MVLNLFIDDVITDTVIPYPPELFNLNFDPCDVVGVNCHIVLVLWKSICLCISVVYHSLA